MPLHITCLCTVRLAYEQAPRRYQFPLCVRQSVFPAVFGMWPIAPPPYKIRPNMSQIAHAFLLYFGLYKLSAPPYTIFDCLWYPVKSAVYHPQKSLFGAFPHIMNRKRESAKMWIAHLNNDHISGNTAAYYRKS